MELSFEEVAVYLGCGGEIGDELKRRTLALIAEAPLEPRGVFLRLLFFLKDSGMSGLYRKIWACIFYSPML